MKKNIASNIKSIATRIQKTNDKVIIFGAGVTGEALFHRCQDIGIQVDYFCDNNSNKTKNKLCGVPVIHTSELNKLVKEPIFLIAAADITDVSEQLTKLGFHYWYDCIELLDKFDVNHHPLSLPADFAEYVISTTCMCHQAFRTPDTLFLRSIDLVITERCSLRCRDCANLMQYYKNPKNYPSKNILKSIDTLSKIVDIVNEVRVIGGEPLINPDFHIIIRELIKNPKFRRIIIYTNGTISPNTEKLISLRSSKILFLITDYGKLSKNLKSLTHKLNQLKIKQFVQPVQNWSACGSISFHKRTEKKTYDLFNGCCSKHVTTLMNGTIYRCPFSANATNLMAVPRNLEDEVNIIGQPGKDREIRTIREDTIRLLSRKSPLQACDYCAGRPYGANEIEPAIQLSSPLEYDKYREVKTNI